jgi:hypothetical protein
VSSFRSSQCLTAELLLHDVRGGRWALLGKALVRGHCLPDTTAQLGVSAAITTVADVV